jgi:aldose 1-epimerase
MLHAKAQKFPVLKLASGFDRCELLPGLGGSIGSWTVQGQPMLRAASDLAVASADPLGCASFPLVPYSNRIRDGHFEWAGRSISLARNFSPEPHSIHGVGFERPWDVCSSGADYAVLGLRHRPGAAWPWPFEAEQRISVANGLLNIEMSAVNLADRPVPLAFGLHPYFPREGAHLQFKAKRVWLMGDDGLPTLCVKPFDKFDYTIAMPVSRGDIDHCYTGWEGSARITWPRKAWALEISGSENLTCAVVCIGEDLEGFCFEPVPHLNDALNRHDADFSMPIAAPGERFTASVRFQAVAQR